MSTDGLPEFKPLVPSLPVPPAAASRPRTPQTIEAAFWLLIASSVLTVVVQLFDYLAIALSGATAPGSSYLVGSFIGIGLRIVFAFGVRRGMNASRILLTLGAGLSVISLAVAFNVILLVLVAIAVVAVVLLWLPTSNAFFRAAAAARAAAKAGRLPR
jgi:hypothetical protein